MHALLFNETANAIKKALASFANINIAIVFGSLANNTVNTQSDLDIVINSKTPLSVDQKIEIINAIELALRL